MHEEAELERALARDEPSDRAWTWDDDVVQLLYGVGLTLERALALAEQPEVRDHLERAVSDIDDMVGALRGDMGQLRRGEARSGLNEPSLMQDSR